jgi:lipid-binding SYLF domain-containing protein
MVGVLGISLLGLAGPTFGQLREASVVESASGVLDEIMATPVSEIPQSLMAGAEGVAIVPSVVKVGFIAGVRHGRGVLVIKDQAGAWTPPQFVTLTGGSVGWQIGVQATDVVLVFKTRRSIQGLLNGTLTLGADASVAAGPLGRKAGAATDVGLKAEIYTYAKSRGLFAGVSLDGSVLQIDRTANALYYQSVTASAGGNATEKPPVPPSATRLMERLARYSGSAQMANTVPADAFSAQAVPPWSEPAVRTALVSRSRELETILDERWKAYLALPAQVSAKDEPPELAALSQSLARYDTVAVDPRYRTLARRREFQATHQLLRQYVLIRTSSARAGVQLPPPPSDSSSARQQKAWRPQSTQ